MTWLANFRFGPFKTNCSGAAAVEFAMVSSAFVTVIIGIAYVGIMLFNNLSLDWAMQRAVRQVTLNHAITQPMVASAINDYLTSVGLSNASVEYIVSTSNGVQSAFIAAHYNQSYSLPFVSTFNITYSSSAIVPIGA